MPFRISAIFLDDGGVLNDNSLRAPQWERLVAAYLAPRLGGDTQTWAQANKVVFEPAFSEMLQHFRERPDADYIAYWDQYQVNWLLAMCDYVGVHLPTTTDPLALAKSR